jgi:GT2 family glycosyltransferase
VPSIIVPARNNETYTSSCLETILYSVSQLNLRCEFILIDDASEPGENILDVFSRFRANAPEHQFKIVRTRKRQHYSGVFSIGIHLSTLDPILFISNDMFMTPYFLKALHSVSRLSDAFGIVRGTSNFTDSLPEHQVVPPEHPKDYWAVMEFSRKRAELFGSQYVEDDILSGDAILLKRSVVERIGVLDLRFYGYFGDVDYGMRAQLAGFKLVCANGAWLFHKGAGHVKREAERDGTPFEDRLRDRMALVDGAYQEFRRKWNVARPEKYPSEPRQIPLREIALANRARVPLKFEMPPGTVDEDAEFY